MTALHSPDPSGLASGVDVIARRAGPSAAAAVGGLALVVVMVADVGGVLRAAVGLVAIALVPGWAVVGFLPLRSPPARLALTVATSLALVMVVAQIMLWTNSWHATVAVVGLVAAAAVICAVQVVRVAVQLRR